jgi:hypothetical protein
MTLIFPYLDAILKALHDNSTLHALVDGNLFKFKSLEESEPCLSKSLHQSLISVELKGWPGSKLVANPVPIIDIRCRKGPEDCLRIAKLIKDILDDGISEVIDGTTYAISVSSLAGDMAWNETLQAWRGTIEAQGIIYTAATITSLTPSLASPQKPKAKVYWFCACPESASDDIRYRFSLNGPGTGNVWQDMTGWTVQSYWQWTISAADVGSNQVKVEVRNAKGLPTADDSEIANYTVSANALPVLTSLTPSIASPQVVDTKVSFVAVASDSEGDWILYRFWLRGPGTGNAWQDQTGWISKNQWSWIPELRDIGANQVKVDIIDQQHAGRSGYDDTETISFMITANALPTIEGITCLPANSQFCGLPVKIIVDAQDTDHDNLLYKFQLAGRTEISDLEQIEDIPNSAYFRDLVSLSTGLAFAIAFDTDQVLRSTDGGLIWEGFGNLGLNSIYSVAAFEDGTVLISGSHSDDDLCHILRSTDSGDNFTTVYTYSDTGYSIRGLHAYSTGLVFAYVSDVGDILRSSNFGASWSVVYTTEKEDLCGFCVFDNGVVLTGFDELFRSTNWGINWSVVSDSGIAGYISCLVSDPATSYGLAGGSSGKLYKTENQGLTYSLLHTFDPGAYNSFVNQIQLLPSGLMFCSVGNKIYKSPDFGATPELFYTFSVAWMNTNKLALQATELLVAEDYNGYAVLFRSGLTNIAAEDLSGWRANSVLTWTPCLHYVGDNIINVMVRDGKHAPPGSYDVIETINYTIQNYGAPTIATLLAFPDSPQVAETPITFVCLATDPNGQDLELLYKFLLQVPGGVLQWRDMTGWRTKNHWTWTPTVADTGPDNIQVRVRNGKLAGPGSYDALYQITFEVES